MNISIVDMIDENFRKTTNGSNVDSECIDKSRLNLTAESRETSPIEARTRFPSLERRLLDAFGVRNSFQ